MFTSHYGIVWGNAKTRVLSVSFYRLLFQYLYSDLSSQTDKYNKERVVRVTHFDIQLIMYYFLSLKIDFYLTNSVDHGSISSRTAYAQSDQSLC